MAGTIPTNPSVLSRSFLERLELDLIQAATIRGPLRVLVMGAPGPVGRAFNAIRGDLRAPIREYQDECSPDATENLGTVIVPEVANLTAMQQGALVAWLTRCPRTSIVALSSESLWPRVAEGDFRTDLFYRLNVITIDLTDCP